MHPNKRNVLGVIAQLLQKKKSLPTHERVQEIKQRERTSIDDAITLLAKHVKTDRQRNDFKSYAEIFAKTFKRWGDSKLREKRPDLHNLWLTPGIPVAVCSGGNQGGTYNVKLSDLTSRASLLARINLLRRKKGMSVLKSVTGTKEELEDRIKKLEASIIKDSVPAFKVHPTAVAEGAYRSEEEAVAKTAHTMHGKTRAQVKLEKRNERFIDKRILQIACAKCQGLMKKGKCTKCGGDGSITGDASAKLAEYYKTKEGKRAAKGVVGKSKEPEHLSTQQLPKGNVVTLADIARSLNMLPKVARQKARKNKKALSKLELSKYKYDPKNKAKVAAILKGGA